MKLPAFVKEYRFLLIVYGLAAVVTLYELTGSIYPEGKEPTIQIMRENRIYWDKKAELESTLYPDSASACFHRGRQHLFAQPPEFEKARHEFERAINRGIKSHEMLLHHYAVTLILLEEDPAEVEAAINNWRWNHPQSTFIPPREFAAQLLASLARAEQSGG